MDIEKIQKELCQKYGALFFPLDLNVKLGIADDFFSEKLPLNGLRIPPGGSTCGWFLWAGEEMSQNDDYFKPLHVIHLIEKYPKALKYLGLPPGWRFLFAGDYEDAWLDEKLLNG
ncbi:MAG TPA: hypothetical protein VIL74_24765 [Pyrinomonadaceae bacterium]|jgi:hypothetical protein